MKTCKIEPFKTIQALYRANKPFKAKPNKYFKLCDNVQAEDLEILGDYMNGLMQVSEKYKKPVVVGGLKNIYDGGTCPYIMSGNHIEIISEQDKVHEAVRRLYGTISRDLK